MVDRVGQQLGNYRLVRLLGRGGFAEVYLGEHERDHTLAAVKVLQTRLISADDLKVFIKEARSFRLIHPNIVRLLDFDIGIDDNPFLVMEYAPNGTLRQRHPRGSRLPVGTVSTYVKQIAAALQYAHDKGLIHRDVKPENMLLGQHNEVLLSDFGIATIAHSTSSMSVQVATGTVPYMAPEQIQAHPRPASDQYSLGIVVYEWLSGDRPFSGSYTEIAVKHSVVPPPPLHEKVPDLSSDVEQVVLTALAKDPKQRFGSVRAFANAFEQASQSFIPIDLIRPANQTLPTELATPASQASLLPIVLTTPSNPSPIPPDTVPPPSQPLQSTAIPNTTRSAAVPTATRVNLVPLGLSAFTVTLFLFSAMNAGFFHVDNSVLVLIYGLGGLIQLIVGVQLLRTGNTLAATALCSYGGFWLVFGFILFTAPGLLTAYGITTYGSCTTLGFFSLGWTIFSGLMLLTVLSTTIGVLRSNMLLIAVFGTLFLTFLFLTAGALAVPLGIIGGYLGILTAFLTAVLAWYIATHRSEPIAVLVGSRADPIPLGLSAFALTIFVVSTFNIAGSFSCYQFQILTSLPVFYGGLIELIAWVLALRIRDPFAATAFCINGGFWLILGLANGLGLIPASSVSYLLLVWAILTVPIFMVALKTNIAFIVISSLTFLTLLASIIGILVGAGTFILVGGWLGILLAIVAWYTALAFLFASVQGRFLLPIGRRA